MASRFQGNHEEDEIDREAKELRHTPALIIVFLLLAAVHAVFTWVTSKSWASYEKDLAGLLGLGIVCWFFVPFYYEFRIRTKEIHGTAYEIEKSITALRENQQELLEKLGAVEEELRLLKYEE